MIDETKDFDFDCPQSPTRGKTTSWPDGIPYPLYGLGMSYWDISSHIEEMYGLEVSTGILSAATDKILQTVKERQARPLERVYPIVWDALFITKSGTKGRWLARLCMPFSALTFASVPVEIAT